MDARTVIALQGACLAILSTAVLVLIITRGEAPAVASDSRPDIETLSRETLEEIRTQLSEIHATLSLSRETSQDRKMVPNGKGEVTPLETLLRAALARLARLDALQAVVHPNRVHQAAVATPMNLTALELLHARLGTIDRQTAAHGLLKTPFEVLQKYGAPTQVRVDSRGNAYWEYLIKRGAQETVGLYFHFVDGLVVKMTR